MQPILSYLQVKELLRAFHIIIYTGDALGDCMMMEDELKELHQEGLLDTEMFRAALFGVRKRMAELKENSKDL